MGDAARARPPGPFSARSNFPEHSPQPFAPPRAHLRLVPETNRRTRENVRCADNTRQGKTPAPGNGGCTIGPPSLHAHWTSPRRRTVRRAYKCATACGRGDRLAGRSSTGGRLTATRARVVGRLRRREYTSDLRPRDPGFAR